METGELNNEWTPEEKDELFSLHMEHSDSPTLIEDILSGFMEKGINKKKEEVRNWSRLNLCHVTKVTCL